MTKFMTRFVRDESGATAIEYGLIAALMAVAVIAAVSLLQPQMTSAFDKIGAKMDVVS
jgi:pilus assembly protein Flp/PilA